MYDNWICWLYTPLLIVIIVGINIALIWTKTKINHRFILIISSIFLVLEIFKAIYQLFIAKNPAGTDDNMKPIPIVTYPSLWFPLYLCSFSWICAFIYSLTWQRFIGRCFLGAYFALGFILTISIFIDPDAMMDNIFNKTLSVNGFDNFSNVYFSVYSCFYHTCWCILFFIIFINLRVCMNIKKFYWQGGVTACTLLFIPFCITLITRFACHITRGWDWIWLYNHPSPIFDGIYANLGNYSALVILSIYYAVIWGFLILLIMLRVKLQNKYPAAFKLR